MHDEVSNYMLFLLCAAMDFLIGHFPSGRWTTPFYLLNLPDMVWNLGSPYEKIRSSFPLALQTNQVVISFLTVRRKYS